MESENQDTKSSSEKSSPKVTQCRQILVKSGYALVQNENRRYWVMPNQIVNSDGDIVDVENLEAGIPYGVDFSAIKLETIDGNEFDIVMKKYNLWTYEDVAENPQSVINAVREALGFYTQQVLSYARDYSQEEK